MTNKHGFTLLEILLVVAAIGIMAGIVIMAVNPGRQLAAARNAQRKSDVASIAQALYQYGLDHDGAVPEAITTDVKMIGTATTGCAVSCGPTISSLSSDYSASDTEKNHFDQGTYVDTQYDSVKNGVVLASGTSGTFLSNIKDSDGVNTNWANMTWTQSSPIPSNKELPDNKATETGYQSGTADMTGNILLMHLNEAAEATSFTDSSGSQNSATCGGVVCPTMGGSGKFNTSGSFDGLNDYISVADTSALQFVGGEMTISVWIKPDPTETYGRFFSKPWNGNGEYNYWIEYYNKNISFCVGVIYTRYACVTTPHKSIIGEWNHVAVTVNSSTMKIFLNGAGEKSKQYTITNWVPDYGDKKVPLAVGTLYPYSFSWAVGHTGFSFKGDIDELAMFNRVLSPAEILNMYQRGSVNFKLQARSCADSSCSSSVFLGPDGTTGTFYTNAASGASGSSSNATLNLPANRFFQYKAFFSAASADTSSTLSRMTVAGSIPPAGVDDSIGLPTVDSCIDLTQTLAGTYITDLPTDPSVGSADKTLYAVSKNEKGVVTVTSCASENGVVIQAKQ